MLLLPSLTQAQTGMSLRMQSLNPAFAGIVDDFLTDAWLNPARVGQLEGSMVYGTRHSRSLDVPYPFVGYASLSSQIRPPAESYYLGFNYSPLAISWIDGNAGGMALSFTVEGFWQDNERRSETSSINYSTTEVNLDESISDNRSEFTHLILDFAVSQRRHAPLGVRLTGTYDHDAPGYLNVRVNDQFELVTPNELVRDTYLSGYSQNLERLALDLEVGVYSPDGIIRDAVIGAGATRDKLKAQVRGTDIWDNDADRNGQDPNGGLPDFTYDNEDYLSNRWYSGYNLFARANLTHGEHVRSSHRIGWLRLTGDGDASWNREGTESGFNDRSTIADIAYLYDGDRKDFYWTSALGYQEEFADEFLIVAGARGAYSRQTFVEDGSGLATVTNSGIDNPLQGSASAPYSQRHDNTVEVLHLEFPVGLEWKFHRYAALRVNASFYTQRTSDDNSVKRNVVSPPTGLQFPGTATDGFKNVSTATSMTLGSGIEINVKDRLVFDMLYTGALRFAYFTMVSARLQF